MQRRVREKRLALCLLGVCAILVACDVYDDMSLMPQSENGDGSFSYLDATDYKQWTFALHSRALMPWFSRIKALTPEGIDELRSLLPKKPDSMFTAYLKDLLDVAMVFAVSLMVAMVLNMNMAEMFSNESFTIVKNPGKENIPLYA